jgi:hypothetical protein
MIDILIKNNLSKGELLGFLMLVFSVDIEKLMVVSIIDFSEMGAIDFSGVDCLCVYDSIGGDASKLLQLYRYKISDDELICRLQMACEIEGIACYVPRDSFDNWSLMDGGRPMKNVRQIESAEGVFLFDEV